LNSELKESPQTRSGDLGDLVVICLAVAGMSLMAPAIWRESLGAVKYTLSSAAILAIVIGWLVLRRLPLTKTLRVHSLGLPPFLRALAIAALSAPLLDELDRLVSGVIPLPGDVQRTIEGAYRFNDPLTTFWLIFGVAVVAPLSEELIFRGVVLKTLERFRGKAHAVLLASLLFALIHFNSYWTIQLVVLAIWISYWVLRYDSILPGWFIHGANNLWGLLLINGKGSGWGNFYLGHGHVHPLIIIGALALIHLLTGRFRTPANSVTLD